MTNTPPKPDVESEEEDENEEAVEFLLAVDDLESVVSYKADRKNKKGFTYNT